MAKQIPLRSEAQEQFTWNTADLCKSDDAFREEVAKIREKIREIRTFEGRLGESGETLLAFFRLLDEIDEAADPVLSYAFRKGDEDTRNPVYQELNAQARNAYLELMEATAFADPEILAIDEAKLEGFYKETEGLEHYRLALSRILKKKEHTLSPECEALLASAARLGQAPGEISAILGNADQTFPSVKDSKGEEYPLSNGSYISLMMSPDRTLRENAFRALYGVYGQYRNTSAGLLSAQMKQLQFFADARKYESALHAALDHTEVDPQIYHNLISAVHKHLPTMHRYVKLRKKLLGLEELHYYDLYASMVADEDVTVTFEEAKELSLKALAPLGENYLSILKEAYENRWLDVYENQGKRSGAYSAGVYGVHPFVLLNYTDTLDDAFTLVHEMGHALHSYLSDHTQSVTYAGYKIFVAEVASTCNEALLMQYLLKETTDKKRRAYLINHFLEQFRGTLYRQTMFAEFELWCSEQTRKGEALTAEALCKKYGELNALYYGEDIVADPEIAVEWARIPHFYYNFYVYQYATGFSCAIALSQKILKEGESAVKDYLGFLSGGCSKDPVSLLKGAGVDISTPVPVEEALNLFDRLLGEMEELMI